METKPNPEKTIEKEEVVNLIKAKGLENREVKELILQWTVQRERLITQASIIFNIDRADLYLAAQDIEGALKALEDVREQAFRENEMELYRQIMLKMDEIEHFLEKN